MSPNDEAAMTSTGVQDSLIVLVPVATMLAGSFATFMGKPSERTEARFQRLSAGLLVGCVVLDIWPETQGAMELARRGDISSVWTIVAAVVGFLFAVLVMYGLKSLELDGGEEEQEEAREMGEKALKLQDVATGKVAEADPELGEGVPAQQDAETGSTVTLPSEAVTADATVADTSTKSDDCERSPAEAKGERGTRAALAAIPWSFVLAVVVDAGVDGLLVGVSAAVSAKSGRLMAIASGIEMGFLGYSYGRSIMNAGRNCVGFGLLVLPPLVMFVSALCAAVAAASLQSSPAFAGVLAFALVALLFLVFEELLPESGEAGAEKWHIGGFLYLGILIAIVLDQSL